MAKLIIPKVAYQFTKCKKGKWHLPSGAVDSYYFVSFCKKLLEEDVVSSPISKLNADDICKTCLGPMRAVDNKVNK